MAHLPTIISDLAMILLVAGVTTILFKKINQPLVLGYIIAGFITGPNFSLFPTIAGAENVQAWSEIGVIFLLFALGLEFSFYKLKTVGPVAFVATSVIVISMLATGYFVGGLLGWSEMDRIFLAGMVSMSSTSIVIKAFNDLKMRTESFTEVVFGILIIEDIVGIIMLVTLATMAVATAGVSPMEILMSVGRLAFFLVLWFVLGMYLVPSFYKHAEGLMNDETLVVASIGLCLGMVVLASSLGFSSALGAFIMGSLIAEAPNAERIEHLISPIKDLFGAVFFVSVGMMVNPSLLLEHWLPILVLVLTVIGGNALFSTCGVLASGQSLRTSLQSSFSLMQIGEFSFILASLGTSLGVISDFLYPIIVAVSVITTFTTPFCMNLAIPCYESLLKILPPKLLERLNRYTNNTTDTNKDSVWRELITSYATKMIIYATLLFAIGVTAQFYVLPYLSSFIDNYTNQPWYTSYYDNIITASLCFIIMAPILRAILINRAGNADLFSRLWFEKRANHLPLLVLILGKVFLASATLYFIFHNLLELNGLIVILAIVIAVYFISTSDWLMSEYLRIESRFLVNLNEKHMRKHKQANTEENASNWFDEELQLATYAVAETSPFLGQTMRQAAIREKYGCNVLQLITDNDTVDMPGGEQIITQNAQLLIIGTQEQLTTLDAASKQRQLGLERTEAMQSLRAFMLANDQHCEGQDCFQSLAISIDEHSPILGTSLKAANLRNRWKCLVIGLERGAFTFTNPNVALVFEENDLLWILGKQKMMHALVREEII